jgi:hypothetical protein
LPPPDKPTAKKAFPLRLDPALYAAIERAAAGDFRSVNAEVEVLLREALERRGVKVGVSDKPKRGRPARDGAIKEGSGYE